MKGIVNIEKRLSALEAQVRKLVDPKAAADSRLVRLGDLGAGDAFEFNDRCYIKISGCYIRSSNGPFFWHYGGDVRVRPIEVEIREKVPGEVSVEIDADDTDTVCELLACSCLDCNPYEYTWTLTATPKTKTKTKTTEEAN